MAGYGSDVGYSAWLVDNGHQLPAEALPPAVLRQRGSAYIDGTYGPDFVGVAANGFSQERAWPRAGAEAFGQPIPSNVIPVAIEQASYAAAWYEATNPGALTPAASQSGAVKRKKLDVLEVEYFQGSGNAAADAVIRIAAVDGLLAPFLNQPEASIFVI